MRRILFTTAILTAVICMVAPAGAAPPQHDSSVTKNIAVTIPPLDQCPTNGATSIDLVFSEQLHLVFTDNPGGTFHFTNTQTGTFTVRGSGDEALATGHFVNTVHDQGPGFPTEAFTSVINAVGKSSDGSLTSIHISNHFTITPNGVVASEFEQISC
jgi:hypothetical protein